MRPADVALAVRIVERNALRHLQPRSGLVIRAQLGAQRFGPGVDDRTLLLIVGNRQNRLQLIGAAAQRNAVMLRQTRAEDFVEPVRARNVRAGVGRRVGQHGQLSVVRVVHGHGPYVAELLRIEQRGQIHRPLEAERHVDVHARLAGLGLAGGNQHDTARSDRCTVDGGRRRILEHGHRLDVLDHVGGIGHAVHHYEHAVARGRVVVVTLRTASADRERRRAHRVAARLLDRHARHAALQEGAQVGSTAACRLVHLDRRNGHREVLLTLRTVTDGYDFADHRGVLFHDHVDLRAIHHCDALRLIADERKLQHGIARYRNLVLSVRIGRHAVDRAAFDDRSTDQRILTGIRQTPRNRHAVLCPGRKDEHTA